MQSCQNSLIFRMNFSLISKIPAVRFHELRSKRPPDIANDVSGGLALRSGSLALVDARREVGLSRRTISGSAEREPRVHSTASMQKAIGSRCSTLELELVGITQIFPPSVGKRIRFLGLTPLGEISKNLTLFRWCVQIAMRTTAEPN